MSKVNMDKYQGVVSYERAKDAPELDKNKHYITFKEGADFYSISDPLMRRMAKAANAVVPFYGGTLNLIDCDVFEAFLEQRRLNEHKLV